MAKAANWILSWFLGGRRVRGLKVLKILLICLTIFILGNAMIPGEISESETQSVAYFVFKNSEIMNVTIGQLPWVLAHAIVRKIGHFGEYACYAMLLVFYETMKLQPVEETDPVKVKSLSGKALMKLVQLSLVVGLLDESIQLVAPARWGSIMDIWIDTLGFVTGMIVTWGVGILLTRYLSSRKPGKSESKDNS